MFQFTWFASYSYGLAIGYLYEVGFPIGTSTGQWIFAPLRSFSQLIASFFASWCLGILLVLFLTWPLLINISVYFQFNCLFKKFWLVFKLLWFSSFFKKSSDLFAIAKVIGGNRILANRLSLAVGLLGILYTQPPSLQSSLRSILACRYGGDKEIRTPDLLLARQALSQLSYTPIYN